MKNWLLLKTNLVEDHDEKYCFLQFLEITNLKKIGCRFRRKCLDALRNVRKAHNRNRW